MVFIPRYTSNVQVQPGPLVDASPVYTALANVFNVAGQEAAKRGQAQADQAAKEQGAIAGMEPDFKVSHNPGRAAQVFNDAGLQSQKLVVGAEVGLKIGSLQDEASKNLGPNSIAQFHAALQGYSKGILEQTPDENKPYMQALFLQHGAAAEKKLQGELKTRNDVFAYAQGMETITNWMNQSQNAAANGDQNTAAAYAAQAEKTARGMAAIGLMAKGTYSSLQIQGRKQLLSSDVLGQYQKAAETGKGQEFLQSFFNSKAYDSVLSPTDKQSLMNHMQAYEKTKLQANGITAESVAWKKKNVILQAQNGEAPNIKDIAAINAYDPENAQNLQNDLSLAGYQHAVVKNAISGNAGEMSETIARLNTLTPEELKSGEAAKISLTNKAAAHQIQQHMNLLKTDPMQATQANPNYQRINATAIQDTPTPEGQNAVNAFAQAAQIPQTAEGINAVQSYIQKSAPLILALQRNQGVQDNKLSLVTNSQAAQMVSQIKQMPTIDQISYLSNLQQLYGESSQYALPALAKAGLPIANQLILRASNDPNTLSYVPSMAAAYSTPTKQLEAALPAAVKHTDLMKSVKNELSQYNSTLYGYNGAAGPVIADMEKQVYQLSLQLVAHGQTASNATQNATDALINNHYQFTSFNGQTYRIPTDANVSRSALDTVISYTHNKINSEPLQVPSHFYPQLPQEKRQALYLSDSVQAGFIVTNPDDGGLTFVDRFGVPVKNADGKPYTVKFNEINSFVNHPEFIKENNAIEIQKAKEREAGISSMATGAYTYANLPTQ